MYTKEFKPKYGAFGIVPRTFEDRIKYLVIKERDKYASGFSGGSEQEVDQGYKEATVSREILEEAGITISYPGDVIYEDKKESGYVQTIFESEYYDGEIKCGPYTEWAKWLTAEEIDKMIDDKNFLHHHKLAWQDYKLSQEKGKERVKTTDEDDYLGKEIIIHPRS